jgi:hypothetical protein
MGSIPALFLWNQIGLVIVDENGFGMVIQKAGIWREEDVKM